MKTLKNLFFILFFAITLVSCIKEVEPEFVATSPSAFALTNAILPEYVLNANAANNIGERFTWNKPDFGTQTNINYELLSSLTSDFSSPVIVNSTSANEMPVTIQQLLSLAGSLGLDNDPSTPASNAGTAYFKVRAFAGSSNSTTEVFTQVIALNLFLPEITNNTAVCEFDQLYLVGAGVPDAGWGWDTPVVIACSGNGIYSGNVNFSPANGGNFRFFTQESNWGSGRNFDYYVNAGYTIDSDFVNAMDGDHNFQFVGTAGLYYIEVNDTAKTITLGPPQATGNCEFDQLWLVGAGVPDAGWGWDTPVQLLCNGEGIYSGNVRFSPDNGGNFRFFTESDNWGSGRNYPYYVNAGYTIDSRFVDALDGDNNFKFVGTAGIYFLKVNDVAKQITLE